ncbi:DUF554 family protein [Wolbachia endosymbiont of Ctenocephalides felis wCfeJ]|uniref:DUF554 family protein n=1 Tax=Wolbachia endosymbiont of Ctenocephalides felis wCfeJ TaxID=2732594 RepID=UPI001444E594|nr:DUF554 family protein [Wolbachia endosymbiont of Ctenocephalides felis wCfeJ]WCR58102.1 MAG: hypothetical protein PG980_000574 [Wolbachia endosymbiont of Ctenocephalides felis wCfeJ]
MSGRKNNYKWGRNKEIDKTYDCQFYARIVVGISVGVGTVTGALAGLVPSLTALSPLVIGGVIGAVLPVSLVLVAIGLRCYYHNDINRWKKEEGIVEKRAIAAFMPSFLFGAIASVATGACLAATANAVLPGVFATWWAIAVGAGIGAFALPTGIITGAVVTSVFAGSIHEFVTSDDYVIGPRTA